MVQPDSPVSSVATSNPIFTEGTATLRQVAAAMEKADCGALLVRRGDGGLAIVTERDISRGIAGGANSDDEWVVDVMTSELLTAEPTDSIAAVGHMMTDANVRHIVIIDPAAPDAPGIVSIRDVLDALNPAS